MWLSQRKEQRASVSHSLRKSLYLVPKGFLRQLSLSTVIPQSHKGSPLSPFLWAWLTFYLLSGQPFRPSNLKKFYKNT
jgi:hypothetical protein